MRVALSVWNMVEIGFGTPKWAGATLASLHPFASARARIVITGGVPLGATGTANMLRVSMVVLPSGHSTFSRASGVVRASMARDPEMRT